jgi:N-acetylglucosaminyldiphosphoundecaprenol N-acetyl-beta-D-mannosaminyltransferase
MHSLSTESVLPKADVTGVLVTALPFHEQIDLMTAWAKQRSSRIVCLANVHMLMEARWNERLRRTLEKSDLVTPDGMPLVWVMRILGFKHQDRVAGMDVFMAACREAVKHDISVYLLGSTPDVLEQMQIRLKKDFPTLKLTGVESPPFRPLTETEDREMVKRINDSAAGFTFVSLGCPKQECWMANHYRKVNSVMIGLGGVFPVYAGLQKHAPIWVRKVGLEWLYRLLQEPKRLYKRYLVTIPPFIWLAAKQITTQRSSHRSFRI